MPHRALSTLDQEASFRPPCRGTRRGLSQRVSRRAARTPVRKSRLWAALWHEATTADFEKLGRHVRCEVVVLARRDREVPCELKDVASREHRNIRSAEGEPCSERDRPVHRSLPAQLSDHRDGRHIERRHPSIGFDGRVRGWVRTPGDPPSDPVLMAHRLGDEFADVERIARRREVMVFGTDPLEHRSEGCRRALEQLDHTPPCHQAIVGSLRAADRTNGRCLRSGEHSSCSDSSSGDDAAARGCTYSTAEPPEAQVDLTRAAMPRGVVAKLLGHDGVNVRVSSGPRLTGHACAADQWTFDGLLRRRRRGGAWPSDRNAGRPVGAERVPDPRVHLVDVSPRPAAGMARLQPGQWAQQPSIPEGRRVAAISTT